MSKEAAIGATVIVGGLVALQAPINAALGRAIGSLGAGTVNFAVGLVVVFTLTMVVAGGFSSPTDDDPIRWYYLVGGAMGVAIVVTTLITVKTLGAGGVTAATIAGQLTVSMLADRLGILGLTEKPISAGRIAGVILLGLGVFLIVRE